jgi:hypothetical protein
MCGINDGHKDMGKLEVEPFLTHIAIELKISPTKIKPCLPSFFAYLHVLEMDLSNMSFQFAKTLI